MRRTILILFLLVAFVSCTKNRMARQFGGKETIQLPKGQRLLTATWKQDNLWYLMETMPDGYTPQTKTFKESSSFETWEGQVTFVESR